MKKGGGEEIMWRIREMKETGGGDEERRKRKKVEKGGGEGRDTYIKYV